MIIGFAIIETSKFIAEEQIMRDQELRSAVESRRSLTKFITIIVIAASLEALVMIFETSRTDVTKSIYPAALFVAAMLALVALGVFQWLSSRIALPPERRGRAGSTTTRPPSRTSERRPRGRARAGSARVQHRLERHPLAVRRAESAQRLLARRRRNAESNAPTGAARRRCIE